MISVLLREMHMVPEMAPAMRNDQGLVPYAHIGNICS